MSEEKTISILYIASGPLPLDNEPDRNMFHRLSSRISGYVISPIWFYDTIGARKTIEEVGKAMGRFTYIALFATRFSWFASVCDLFRYCWHGIRIYYRQDRFDAIVAYGTYKTGLAGCLIKLCTGARLIVRIPGTPGEDFLYDGGISKRGPSYVTRIKMRCARLATMLCLFYADRINTLYPGQLSKFNEEGYKDKISCFFDFAAIALLTSAEPEPFLLFIGYDFYRKGVDTLISAFREVEPLYPHLSLKIVGFCDPKELEYYKGLAYPSDRIEFLGPVKNNLAMELMRRCSAFILASRQEGMGRVFIEAMACGRPIIGSRAGGTPSIIQDGYNGLLFTPEDVGDLATKIRRVMDDPQLAKRLGENGLGLARSTYSEERFVEHFTTMVRDTVRGHA